MAQKTVPFQVMAVQASTVANERAVQVTPFGDVAAVWEAFPIAQ